MKNIIDELQEWINKGDQIALATVINFQGSSPREIGAVMAVNHDGKVLGSISGGCVESAVIEESLSVIETGQPKLLSYGISDELGFSVGLTCGGTIEIFVENLTGGNVHINAIASAIKNSVEQPIAIATIIATESAESAQLGQKMIISKNGLKIGSLDDEDLERAVILDAQGLIEQGLTTIHNYGKKGDYPSDRLCQRWTTEISIYIEAFTTAPHLIIFGAVDFGKALCKLGKILGYRVTICDARSRFATVERFPEADQIIVEFPRNYLNNTYIDDRTVILVLTHDPKFDVPALINAVKTPANYIGAMGSRKATKDRIHRLKEAGMSDIEIKRINAPLGLDIGAKTPEETAVSIMAEVIALKNQRKGGKLSENQEPIHNIQGEIWVKQPLLY